MDCAICYNSIIFKVNCNTCISKFCTDCLPELMDTMSDSCPVCRTGKLFLPITDDVKNKSEDDNTLNYYCNLSNTLHNVANR